MVAKVDENSHGDCEVPKVWTFKDDSVANNFQYHVTHQLPWYNTCTEFVQSLITSYVSDDGLVYDIGASKGNITKALIPVFEKKAITCIPIEPAPQMVEHYQGAGEPRCQTVKEFMDDEGLKPFDVAVCFLSCMFMTASERRHMFNQLKHVCKDGGVIIIVDKEVPKKGYVATAFSRARQQLKANQGVPHSEIAAKELSLAGVQRPIDPWLELGDGWVEFFRMGEFVGWLYEKNLTNQQS